MSRFTDEDYAAAGAFVDGEMAEPERTRFELRLAAEPMLAQHVEELLRMDEVARDAARRHVGARSKSRLRLVPAFALAAATVAVVFGVRAWLDARDDAQLQRAFVQVALVPSFESATEWIARDPLLAGQRPPGIDEMRGANEPPNVDARTFLEAVLRLESRHFGLATPPVTTAAFFALPIRATEPVDVLVFGFPTRGTPVRYWPKTEDLSAARVESGDHVLPGASFTLVTDPRGDRIEYQRGFLVPIGAQRMSIVVATRPTRALDAQLLAPANDASSAMTELESAGFATQTFTVVEP